MHLGIGGDRDVEVGHPLQAGDQVGGVGVAFRVRPVAAAALGRIAAQCHRSEEHTSELQSLMRISYAVFCLHKKKKDVQEVSLHYRLVKPEYEYNKHSTHN